MVAEVNRLIPLLLSTPKVWPKMLKWNFETCTVPWAMNWSEHNTKPKIMCEKKTDGKYAQLFDGL